MAESMVSSVATYLGGLLMEEAKILGGVVDQIDNIHDEMVQMQCFLRDADSRQHESESVHNLVADIRDLAYNAEDVVESYILKAKYESSFNLKKYIRLHQIRNEIDKLQSKIQVIACRVPAYNFIRFDQGEGTSSTSERQRQLRQSFPHNDDEDVLGIQDNINKLVAKLINKEDRHLVSIVGMGGLGKTTLATKVYNHDDVKRHFDCCAWSCISQRLQLRSILQGIIRKVCNPNEEMRLETLNDEELIEKLSRQLKDRCYLVVLDDIWSTEAWDVLKSAFPKEKTGSKIMLTTRIKNVALHADPYGLILEPACLTEEQSWELFCKKAFLWKNVASASSSSLYIPEVEAYPKEELGRDMVKKCAGLPLAVAVLGSLLATKESIHEWEMMAKDIGRYLNKAQQQQKEQHGVSWILSLSYHDLPCYLKPCFLYLGLYPEDTKVHKRELIHMWIAEGFVQPDGQGITKEEMGEEYLLELINRSMVQVAERSFRGKVKKCRLHDLIRDLCLEKAKEENFLSTSDGESSTGNIAVESISNHRMRRYAIHVTWDNRYVSMQQLPPRSPHLRALFVDKPYSSDFITMPLKFACKNFNFLRVLKLDSVTIDGLPRAIGQLIHLRYLRVTFDSSRVWNRGFKVPATIANLRCLQFLELKGIVSLPNVLWKMEQLTYCHVQYFVPHPDRGIAFDQKTLRVDGLKNLMTLELWAPREIIALQNAAPKLTSLRKLLLYDLETDNCKALHRFWLSDLDRLQCLGLGFSGFCPQDFDLSTLPCCRSLRKLHLKHGIRKLPKLEDFPPNLTKLKLSIFWLKEDPSTTLEMLPNLETLTLEGPIMYTIGAATKYYFSSKGFGRLQYLRLFVVRYLKELEVEKGALPCLMHLQITNCERLVKNASGGIKIHHITQEIRGKRHGR